MNYSFASDNTSAAHPDIMQAMVEANNGAVMPYGLDEASLQTSTFFKELYGKETEVYYALSGTGANVIALKALLRPWHGVICTDIAHINTDECGAPEACTGSKMLTVPSENGKLNPKTIQKYLLDLHNIHHVKPAVLSITQATEQGTVYSVDEIKAITKLAHDNGLQVHMDGARIANALIALGTSPENILSDLKKMTKDAGVDVLSFGGTKNGMMMGEVVIFFKPTLSDDFYRLRKQSLQHLSKMRYLGAQFGAYFKDSLWYYNAKQANDMAQYLANELSKLPLVNISRPTDINMVFATMPIELIKKIQKEYYFYEIDPILHEIRLVCSFATQKEDIDKFIAKLNVISYESE